MQRLEVSVAVRPIYGSLGVKQLRSLCKILRTLRSDSPMAAECLLTEHPGLFTIAFLTLSTFSGVRTVGILPRGFICKAEIFSRKFCTHSFIVLRQGTQP